MNAPISGWWLIWKATKIAKQKVPIRFPAKTIPHRRSVRSRLRTDGVVAAGRTAVSVLSVNSCMRPAMTAMNPSE